jgi:hypothetical protein
MKKISHFGEAAYILGLLFLSMGTALMAKSDFAYRWWWRRRISSR